MGDFFPTGLGVFDGTKASDLQVTVELNNPNIPEEELRKLQKFMEELQSFAVDPASIGIPARSPSDDGTPAAKRGKREKSDPNADVDKKRARREKNREAAARCRQRRRDTIESLELATSKQKANNAEVEQRIAEYQAEIAKIRASISSHRCVLGGVVPLILPAEP